MNDTISKDHQDRPIVHQGGCHCGDVRFECYDHVSQALVCHCYDCMKTIGTSIVSSSIALEDITITGKSLKWYQSSDIAERGFCGHCGASMFFRRIGSERVSICLGMFDDASGLSCRGQIYADDHPGFISVPADLPHLDDDYRKGMRG